MGVQGTQSLPHSVTGGGFFPILSRFSKIAPALVMCSAVAVTVGEGDVAPEPEVAAVASPRRERRKPLLRLHLVFL